MHKTDSPPRLQSTFVVMNPDLRADALPVTDTIWQELDASYDQFKGRLLVAAFDFDQDWPGWEIHPHGDEIVSLVSGCAEMVLKLAAGERTVTLTEPGAFVIVPRGTWHTARISAPTTMLFVTPGQGTENRAEPGDSPGRKNG